MVEKEWMRDGEEKVLEGAARNLSSSRNMWTTDRRGTTANRQVFGKPDDMELKGILAPSYNLCRGSLDEPVVSPESPAIQSKPCPQNFCLHEASDR